MYSRWVYLAGAVLVAVFAADVKVSLREPWCLNPNLTPIPTVEPTTTAAIIAVITISMRDDRRLDGDVAELPVSTGLGFSSSETASGGTSL